MAVSMFPVNSSNLDTIGWENDTLYITFKKGAKYKYEDVPIDVYMTLRNSSSVGKYYLNNIKGKYSSSVI